MDMSKNAARLYVCMQMLVSGEKELEDVSIATHVVKHDSDKSLQDGS